MVAPENLLEAATPYERAQASRGREQDFNRSRMLFSPGNLIKYVRGIPVSNPVDFFDELAMLGGPVARQHNLPVPAMLACAAVESGFGTSKIFRLTGCPFNLQKPKEWKFPVCATIPLNTVALTGAKPVKVPFCTASGWADAVRLWCEWIENWPYHPNRARVLRFRADAENFTLNLPYVGFGDQPKDPAERSAAYLRNGQKYLKMVRDFSLMSYV